MSFSATAPIRSCIARALLPAAVAATALPAQADIYQDAGRAVVRIHVYGTYKTPQNGKPDLDELGTGFIVSPDGLILTAGHMAPQIQDFKPGQLWIEVQRATPDGIALTVSPVIDHVDILKAATAPHDVAIFKLQGGLKDLPYLRLCAAYSMDEQLTVLGYTGGEATLSKTIGTVKTPSVQDGPVMMQMPLSGGDSGGPVFNAGGRVFAVAIGGAIVNGERLEATTEGEVMPAAIATLSPDTNVLLGLSYDPDCAKPLPLPVQAFHAAQQVNVVSNGAAALVKFRAPLGFRFDDGFFQPKATAEGGRGIANVTQSGLSPDRKQVDVQITAQGSLGFLDNPMLPVLAEIDTRLLPDRATPVTVTATPGPSVRSFAVSRTQSDHAQFGVTTRHYSDTITAPPGFEFATIVKIHDVSLNHSPSHGAHAAISGEGAAIKVDYDLQSGPFYDQWRGWIDAIIVAELRVAK